MTRAIHASCVVIDGHGVLITGMSGSGKSSLALQLIDQSGRGIGNSIMQAQLVADDQVILTSSDGRLFASPPDSLAGLLEVRGLGIVRLANAESAAINLIVELAGSEEIERLPDARKQTTEFAGVQVQRVLIDPLVPSSPARVRSAIGALADDQLADV